MIEAQDAFIEIYVATTLEACEAHDRKRLYAKARQGLIPEFIGISDPYVVPEAPEVRIDTSQIPLSGSLFGSVVGRVFSLSSGRSPR